MNTNKNILVDIYTTFKDQREFICTSKTTIMCKTCSSDKSTLAETFYDFL